MPGWWRRINKHLLNPGELERGTRPVLTHIGRSSGMVYRTPLDAHPVDGGYVFVLVYGSGADWVRNVLAAGRAQLAIDRQDIELFSPRVIDEDEARRILPATVSPPPRILRITEYLQMDHRAP